MSRSLTVTDLETRTRVIDLVSRAFFNDPTARWVFPSPNDFSAHFPEFVAAFAGVAFSNNTVDTAPGLTGAALWLAPGCGPDEASLEELFTRVIPGKRLPDVFTLLEQMGSHHPAEPHWYLPLIGVDPPYQGCGVGSALLRIALARCDSEGLPAYLESSNPENIPLYARHGFRSLGTIQVGDSPAVVPMRRDPVPSANDDFSANAATFG